MKLSFLLISVLQIALISPAVFGAEEAANDDSIRKPVPIRTSLLRVLACPKEFDGKVIVVSGFCVDQPDHRAIYPNKTFVEYWPYPNGLWVEINYDRVRKDLPRKDGKLTNIDEEYVELVGKFNMSNHGTRGLWTSGAIEDIEFIRIVEKYPIIIRH